MSVPVLAAEAEVRTGQPERYVTQFSRHAQQAHRLHRGPAGHGGDRQDRPEVRGVTGSGAAATVEFSTGSCTLTAADGRLLLRAEAAGEQDLRSITELVTRNVERFGHREGLRVSWRPA